MLIRNLELGWADLTRIHIKDIEGPAQRKFAGEVKNDTRIVTIDVYICSDGRNTGIRQILKGIPYVNILSSAGNVIYNPNERPSVVIAHGNSEYQKCGAIEHAKEQHSDKFPAIREKVKKHPIENAQAQLAVVPKKYRAGILYFNHEKCQIENHTKDQEAYPKNALANHLFDELATSLVNRYTDQEKQAMARGQEPDFILLTNISTSYTTFNIFRVDLQRNSFDYIVSDSVGYAMEHALRGEGSFQNTKTAFMTFRKNQKLPEGLKDFLNGSDFISQYVTRGGKVYIITVGDLPSEKTIYRIDPKNRS